MGYVCGGRSACGLYGLCGLWGCCGGRSWGGRGWGLSSEPKKSSVTTCKNEETKPMLKVKLRMERPRVVHAEHDGQAR